MTIASIQWCTTCSRDGSFEQPVCSEGHGADCPEWFCIDCGLAVVLAAWAADDPAVPDRSAA
ncbi:MAG: hypothetical protein WKF47_02350 [Geodermatophilaceae bacterium]|jgi:hypothetical protein